MDCQNFSTSFKCFIRHLTQFCTATAALLMIAFEGSVTGHVFARDAWEGSDPTRKGSILPLIPLPDPDGPEPGLSKPEIGPEGRGGPAHLLYLPAEQAGNDRR